MRSIPQALMWEMFSHGRWYILGFFLMGNALPMLVLGALSPYEVDPNDSALIVMHFGFMPIIMICFAAGIVAAQGSPSRLYTAPISTPSLVAWHMLPGGILFVLEFAFAIWTYNAVFHVGWPILTHALFAAAAWATVQLLMSTSLKTLSSICLAVAPSGVLFAWLYSRSGGWFSKPKHYWVDLTFVEVVTLLGATAVAYVVTVVTVAAVARDRCGEPMPSLGGWKWLVRTFDSITSKGSHEPKPFRSSAHAQFWYEWRLKGLAMPLIVLLGYAGAGSVWLLGIAAGRYARQPLKTFHQGIVAGGALLPVVAGVAGMLLGVSTTGNAGKSHTGTIHEVFGHKNTEEMGHFQSTQPFTNSDFARSILQVASRSVLIAWGLWFAGFAGWLMIAALTRQIPGSIFPAPLEAWCLPLSLLAPWIALTNMATIGLSGRSTRIVFIGVGGLFSYCIGTIVIRQYYSAEALDQVHEICVFIGAIVVLVATPVAFAKAHRRNYLSRKTQSIAAIVSFGIVILAIVLRPMHIPILAYPMILAFAALVILPVATIPLAIAWDRHR